MPTPSAITPVTVADALNVGTVIIQNFGLVAFIVFGGFVAAGAMLLRRVKSAAR